MSVLVFRRAYMRPILFPDISNEEQPNGSPIHKTVDVEPAEVGAALLLAVVVELALPVHHVGAPAMELHFPLALSFINVI